MYLQAVKLHQHPPVCSQSGAASSIAALQLRPNRGIKLPAEIAPLFIDCGHEMATSSEVSRLALALSLSIILWPEHETLLIRLRRMLLQAVGRDKKSAN